MRNLKNIFNREIPYSEEEIRKMYKEISNSIPGYPDELKVGGEFNYYGKCGEGSFHKFYDLGNGIGGKTTNINFGFTAWNFISLRDEFINHKLAEKLNLPVPKIHDFRLYYDRAGNFVVPMIEMENYSNDIIGREFEKRIPVNVKNKFLERKKQVLPYLKYFSFKDITPNNAIWIPEKEDVVLIDTEFWKFRGVKYKWF